MALLALLAGGAAIVSLIVGTAWLRLDRVTKPVAASLGQDFRSLVERAKSGDHDGATALGNKLLAFVGRPVEICAVHAVLAFNAEDAGDFEGAAIHATRALATGATGDALTDARFLRARLAFSHAVAGRLAEAERDLPPPPLETERDSTAALVLRTHALLAYKRGDRDRVSSILAERWMLDLVGPKSRAMFRAMERQMGLSDPYRTSPDTVDPEVAEWVGRVMA
jgi:hypothetical protein